MKNLVYFTIILLITLPMLGCKSELPLENSSQVARGSELAAGDLDLSNADVVEDLIAGSFLTWWQATMADVPSMGLGTISDAYTCGWGNFGMRALSEEPRTAFLNEKSNPLTRINEDPWFELYAAISAANDGIRSIQSGEADLGPDNERAIGFGKLVQGLAHGYLALYFDQGFVFDENTDLLTTEFTLVPYTEVMAAAIQQLQSAIQIFNANTFTLPGDWINGRAYTNAGLSQLAHSFIARYMVSVARDRTERQNVDWNTVLSHLDQGLTADFAPVGTGNGRSDPWFSAVHWYSSIHDTWQRADYQLVGPSDQGTGYQNWQALAPADRSEFIMETGDLRIWDQTLAADGTQNPGTQFRQIGPTPYPGGGYQQSRYGHDRFLEYAESSAGSEIVAFRTSEHDFLRAEALLHTGGSPAEIAALLDKTHVIDGGYAPTADLAVGSITDDSNPRHENGATLWSVLKYEKHIDLLGTWSGLQFWDKRGWGDLTSLTPLHFPVPAKELQFLLIPNYTFGGGGVGSAQ